MSDLAALSAQLAGLTSTASSRIVAVHGADGGEISGIVWRTGLIVTAHEALAGEDDVSVVLPNGSRVIAELKGRDPSTDVALLKADTGEFADWSAAATPVPGSLSLVVGRGGNGPLVSFGAVSEVGPAWRSMRGGQIDARIVLGLRFSRRAEGGAVVAPDGSLIGLAVTGPWRRALAIPAGTVERAVTTLADKGYVARGYLGVSLHPTPTGVIVLSVEPDGPAAKAGFVVGDVVTTWNGEAVQSVGGLSSHLGTGTVGRTAKVGITRGGIANEIELTIGERPRA